MSCSGNLDHEIFYFQVLVAVSCYPFAIGGGSLANSLISLQLLSSTPMCYMYNVCMQSIGLNSTTILDCICLIAHLLRFASALSWCYAEASLEILFITII